MNGKNANDGWPFRCRQHGQPTGMRCYSCEKEPLCLDCAHVNPGLGYICSGCLDRKKARFAQARRRAMA
jgi:hypothetical protein